MIRIATAFKNVPLVNMQSRPSAGVQINVNRPAEYEPGVDGLRAIAVLAVILYHLGFSQISGGFVGVDIFFVISGYLITRIIVTDLARGRFDYRVFMVRRIARLYPALVVMLAISIAFGFLIFSPADYKGLGRSTVSAFLSASNFDFWRRVGYFDTSSETNPLLHTWSLGVEQQFYLVWPLVLFLAHKLGRRAVVLVLCAVCLVSLAASQWMITKGTAANYYLMPFRAFEFAIGGLVLWVQRYRPDRNVVLEILVLVGYSMIVYGALSFTAATAFPGMNALVPAVGAALCILGSNAKYGGMLLRFRPIVLIGLISYSLYLVHWPIIVFYKYYVYRAIDTPDRITLLALSFAFAWPLYALVEARYRRVNLLKLGRSGVMKLAMTACLVVVPALVAYKSDGIAFRHLPERSLPPDWLDQQEMGGTGYTQGSYDLGAATTEKPVAIILGDSYARQHAASLDEMLKGMNKRIHTSYTDFCFFSKSHTSVLYGKPRKECSERLNYALQYLRRHPGLPLIYGINWGGYETLISTVDGKPVSFKGREYTELILNNIAEIAAAIGDHKLIILGSPPGVRSALGLRSCVERPDYLGKPCEKLLTIDQHLGNAWPLNEEMKTLGQNLGNVVFITSGEAFCNNGKCMSMREGRFIYSDAHHLSKFGSKVFVNHFRQLFEKL